MKSMFKKAVPFVFVLSSVAVAAGMISKEAVNAKVAAITAPYNNQNTQIDISFTDLNVDSVRALDFGITGGVWKKGTENELLLKIDNIQYHYGDGKNPTVAGNATAALDLVKALGQKSINEMSAELEETVKGFAASFGQAYGDALTVDAQVLELKKDQNGDVGSVKIQLKASVDFSKLPATMKIEDVEFKSLEAQIAAGRLGAGIAFKVVMNPENKSFKTDQPGLKELIEKLLNEDAQTYQQIGKMAEFLNQLADSVVNMKAQN